MAWQPPAAQCFPKYYGREKSWALCITVNMDINNEKYTKLCQIYLGENENIHGICR